MLDPQPILQHYPLPMRRFGVTPYAEPMYRIVWAPSRYYLVAGDWPDGARGAKWMPLYSEFKKPIWVMEKWLPAERFAGCTREYWELHYLSLGPWPERGEYEVCHLFETSGPWDANLEKLIGLIEHKPTLYETVIWHRRDAEKQLKQQRAFVDDKIRNLLPAFQTKPFASRLVARGTKTVPGLRLSAQEAGLATKPGLTTKPKKVA